MNKKISKAWGILFLLSELVIVPKAIELMLRQHFSELTPVRIIGLTMTFGSIALCILMSYSSLNEHRRYPKQTFLFELMVFLCCLSPMTDLISGTLDSAGRPGLNMLVNTVFYLIGINISYVIMCYEFLIIGPDRPILKKLKHIALIPVLLDNLATLLNVRFGYFFTISESGAYRSAPTFWLAFLAPAIVILLTAFAAMREMRPGRQQRAFLFFWIFAMISSLIQICLEELTVQYTGYTLSLIVIYLNVQSELDALGIRTPEKETSQHESTDLHQ